MRLFWNQYRGLITAVSIIALLSLQQSLLPQPQNVKPEKIRSLTRIPKKVTLPFSMTKFGSVPKHVERLSKEGIITIMSEDFEGVFPTGLWSVGSDDYTWAQRTCAAHSGSRSVWAVGGGVLGNDLTCGANYPNSVSTMIIYGPFDLSDANWAAFSFWVNMNTEESDLVSYYASEDGMNFYGSSLYGSTEGEWYAYTQALNVVPGEEHNFLNLTGKSSVWIAFGFDSDASTNFSGGPYIDDVILQKGQVAVPPLITSFASPGPSPRGMTFDGVNLWCSDATNDRIYKLNQSGTVLTSLTSPSTIPTGMAWDGANLWNVDANSDRIYKLSPSGAVLSSFAAPGSSGSGLCWNNAGFYFGSTTADTIWKLNQTGTVLSTFSAPGTYHYGIAWDGSHLWMVDVETVLIYKIDSNGAVLDYYLAPGPFPNGLACDGGILWMSDRETQLIYKLQMASSQVAHDVGITAINVQTIIAKDTQTMIDVTVKNFGASPQSHFPLSYQIGSSAAVTETFSAILQPGASQNFTFSIPWSATTAGTAVISARTALNGDENPSNDQSTKTVQVTNESVYCSADVPKTLATAMDSVTSSLTVDHSMIISDLNAKLYIAYPYDDDLEVYLTSPSGIRVALFTNVGGIGSNFGSTCSPEPNCIFDDQADKNIAAGYAPFIGRYQTEKKTLDRFNGTQAQGTWTLSIVYFSLWEAGSLNCWCLEFEPPSDNDVGVSAIELPSTVTRGTQVPIIITVQNSGTKAQSNFPISYQVDSSAPVTENYAGTLPPGASQKFTFTAPWTPAAAGQYVITARTALNGDQKSGNDHSSKTVYAVSEHVYCSSDVPKTIGATDSVVSILTIDPEIIIGDLNVRLYIEYPNDTDLDVYLTSPGGIRVELFSAVYGNGNNFGSTCSPMPDCIIDDQADTSMDNSTAPFVGRFRTAGLILDGLRGEPAQGTWTLTIVENSGSWDGTLHCWCLEVDPAPDKDVGVKTIDLAKLVLLKSSIPIPVTIKNYGSEAQSNFPVSYRINEMPAVTEMFSETLAPGATVVKTFASWTAIGEGLYYFTAWTSLPEDARAKNDTLAKPVKVCVRESNATPILTGLADQTVRTCVTKRLHLNAFDADGDSMTYTITQNPGFLSLSKVIQKGDTASTTLTISAPRHLDGTFPATIVVRDLYDATTTVSFTVHIVPRFLPTPQNLNAQPQANEVKLNWQASAIAGNHRFAGIYTGKTGQNLPVYMDVADDGFIDSLNVRIMLYFPGFTCTVDYQQNTATEIQNTNFDARLSWLLTNVYTTLHGNFSENDAVSGTYDKYSGAYFIYCGSMLSFGTGGTQLGSGTWQASKIAPSSGMALPVLLGYNIYRASHPDARVMGILIGTTDANTVTFTDTNPGKGDKYYQITARYDLGESDPASEVLISGATAETDAAPFAYRLEQNYPNPFNAETEIRFQLPKSARVVLSIYNTLGSRVRLLVNATYQPGCHLVRWDGRDYQGHKVASGVYLYRLQAGEYTQTNRMSLLR